MLKLLFLLLTVSAAGAWSVWKWAPDQIQRAEDWAIRGYMKAPNEGLKRAVDLGKAGDWEAAIVILESQAEDLKGYKKLDRLFRLRRRTVQQLAVATAEAGDPLRSSKVVSKFLQDDPKDLPLAIQSAKLLTEADSEEARAAGRERYAELFTWLPLVSTIAEGHIEQLAKHGDPAELELAVAKHLEFVERPVQVMQNLQFGWFFRHGTEAALGKASRSPINPLRQKGELVIPFTVPTGAKFLRIDLPPYAVAELSNARMVLGGKTTHLGEPNELKSLEWREGQMSASGRPVAWFSYPLPELGDQAKVRGSLRFELTALPSWLEAHLGG
ncbi:MAG: hypothetical protein P1V35_15005, partial [Planctomycetota bacterium]|nr:hypothetical protein [Planctomycetota bacterium]